MRIQQHLCLFLSFVMVCGVGYPLPSFGSSAIQPAAKAKIIVQRHANYVVEFSAKPSAVELKQVAALAGVKNVQRLSPYKSEYFSRVYEVEAIGSLRLEEKLRGLPSVKHLSKDELVEAQSIIPSQNPNPSTNDPFFNYQWALWNSGQTLLKDIDDIHMKRLVCEKDSATGDCLEGQDLGWKTLGQDLDAKFSEDRKQVVVAVLDSGIDVEHEDIKNNLYRNTPECKQGARPIPIRPTEDKDGNGYIGDCIGWNFTTFDKRMQNRPRDDDGHGTHVAGIIAAEVNNGIGISGLSNRIKILPVKITLDPNKEEKIAKVVDNDDDGQEEAEEEAPAPAPAPGPGHPRPRPPRKKPVSITSRIAKGMLYATQMKVDVINLSMGWPNQADAPFLREAFAEALKNNITVVAAAGNNNNSAQIFPCAYKGVICVGSVNNKNEYSEFSNFGGHVDVLGPGDNVLSLFPTVKDSGGFSTAGYDIKSGTSQAAPYVSGLVAVLRGVNPNITQDQIMARLYLGAATQPKSEKKHSLAGAIDLKKSLELAVSEPVVRPVFKEQDRLKYSFETKSFKVPVVIKNYGTLAKNVKLRMTSLDSNYSFETSELSVGELAEGEKKSFVFSGSIEDLKKHSELQFEVQLSGDNLKGQNFRHELIVSRDVIGDELVRRLPVVPEPSQPLQTVFVHGQKDLNPEYMAVETIENEGLKLHFYRVSESGDVIKKEAEGFLPKAAAILSTVKYDVDGDGVDDYFIRVSAKEGESSHLQFSFLNKDGQPLLGEYSHLKMAAFGEFGHSQSERRKLFRFDNFKMLSALVDGKKIMIPAFVGKGFTSKEDENTSTLDFERDAYENRLYYYELSEEDEKPVWNVRTFTNYQFVKRIKRQLRYNFRHTVNLLEALPQSEADFAADKINLLYSIGRGVLRDYFVVSVKGSELGSRKYSVDKFETGGLTLEGHTFNNVIDISAGRSDFFGGGAIVGFLSHMIARVLYVGEQFQGGIDQALQYENSDVSDRLLGFRQAYRKGEMTMSFFLSMDNLILVTEKNGEQSVTKRPVTTTSFLPGQVFQESLYPVIKGEGDNQKPAIYVNASQLSSRHVYTWSLEDGELMAPLDMNIDLPNNCVARNPVRFGQSGVFNYSMMCKNGEKTEFQYLPIR